MPWNLNQIREFCNAKNFPYPEVYLRSLSWQHWKARYHAEQAQRVWDEFKLAHPHGYRIRGAGDQWWRVYRSSAAETEASALVLHAEADIIAQIINQVILRVRGLFPEEEVSLRRVSERLRSQNQANNVVAAIASYTSSEEFRYISSFCNIIKHRRLIERQWRSEGGEGIRGEEGVRFLAFEYGGRDFPIMWASDINGRYREALGRYVERIGNAIIDYLQSNP